MNVTNTLNRMVDIMQCIQTNTGPDRHDLDPGIRLKDPIRNQERREFPFVIVVNSIQILMPGSGGVNAIVFHNVVIEFQTYDTCIVKSFRSSGTDFTAIFGSMYKNINVGEYQLKTIVSEISNVYNHETNRYMKISKDVDVFTAQDETVRKQYIDRINNQEGGIYGNNSDIILDTKQKDGRLILKNPGINWSSFFRSIVASGSAPFGYNRDSPG